MSTIGKKTFSFLIYKEPVKPKLPQIIRQSHRRAKNSTAVQNRLWLNQARNELLICRFVYWNVHQAQPYEWVVAQLTKEFYLSDRTITKLLVTNLEAVRLARQKKNFTKWSKDYDFLNW